jgi:hypothetical protein
LQLRILGHGVLLLPSAPCQLRSLAGQEHGRTIPLPDISRLLLPVSRALFSKSGHSSGFLLPASIGDQIVAFSHGNHVSQIVPPGTFRQTTAYFTNSVSPSIRPNRDA